MFLCLIPLLILGLLLILLGLRRKRPTAPPPSTPAAPRPTPLGPHLESSDFPGGPRRFALKPEGLTIGRAMGNDLVITQDFPAWDTVSRHHARVYPQAGHWIVEDLNSMNGTYVNEKRTGRNLLHDDWRLSIGGVEFVFHTDTGEAQQ
jgi:pSer/pThr/pTyr-binding forkhead associated (FHA) protein